MECGIFTILGKPLYCSKWKQPLKGAPLNLGVPKKKTQKNTCEKVHVHVYFSKILRKLKVISSYISEIQERFEQIKLRFSFLLKINFRKMAHNKHVDLRKILY